MRSDTDVKIKAVDSLCGGSLFDYLSKTESFKTPPIPFYPSKQNRYSIFGWNRNHQDCYDEQDIQLTKKIAAEYQALDKHLSNPAKNPFSLISEEKLSGWWVCSKPENSQLLSNIQSGSFTLPSRQEKDSKTYPLWSYADSMGKRIANWQAERVKHQHDKLMNDPQMMILEELKYWFSDKLSISECKEDTIELISARQSYLKSLIYLVPDFGPDKLRLHDIQESLIEASKTLSNCVASKNLPQLLSDVVTATKSLENSIGTYLHFLLIDEPVSDNFSPDHLSGKKMDCDSSPICRIFQHNQKLYDLIKKSDIENGSTYALSLNKDAFSNIKFAPFVSMEDKNNYIEAITSLQTLINVRKLLDDFHSLQSKIGTYSFAHYYLDKTNELTENYITLIERTRTLILSMIDSSRKAAKSTLINHKPTSPRETHFQRNFRLLNTGVAKGTTLEIQIDSYFKEAISNMQKYQSTLKRIAADVHSGKASIEIENAMHSLFKEINQLNSIIPALTGNKLVFLPNPTSNKFISDSTSSLVITETEDTCPTNDQSISTTLSNPLFDHGNWDEHIKFDPNSHEPIFTYRVYKQKMEVGSIEFYGQPLLCASQDGRRHNLQNATGLFTQLQIPDDASIEEICRVLPSTLFDRVIHSAGTAAVNGALRGGSSLVGMSLRSLGASEKVTFYLKHFSYYSTYFIYRFFSHYHPSQEHENESAYLTALAAATSETGQIFLLNSATGLTSALLNKIGNSLEQSHWNTLGSAFKKCGNLVRFGLFAYNASNNGLAETTSALVAGTLAEVAVEEAGKAVIPM